MRRPHRIAFLSAVLILVAATGGSVAFAGNSVGSFEIDGDFLDSADGEPIDWSTPPPNLTDFVDATETGDDVFGEGSKWQEPGGWTCSTGSAPSKDDIESGSVAFRLVGGKQFVYARLQRVGVNGDAHLDIEFNRSAVPNPSCPAMPSRSDGDLIIAFDTQNGGSTIDLNAYRWSGDASVGTFVPLTLGAKGTTWDGAVNIPDLMGLAPGAFGEAALNISDTIGEIACGYFVSAHLAARASASASAALKDRTAAKPVDTGNCPDPRLTKGVRNVSAGETVFTTSTTADPGDILEYELAYVNAGSFEAHDVVVTDEIPQRTTFVSCTAGCTVAAGAAAWSLGTVAPAGTSTAILRVQLDATFPAGSATIDNVATVRSTEEPAEASNVVSAAVTSVPDTSIVKAVRNVTAGGSFSPSTAGAPGDVIEYRLTVTNAGTGPATALEILDPLPPGTSFLACSDGCAGSGGQIRWAIGSIPALGSVMRTFHVQLDGTFTQARTTITNLATLDTAEELPEDSNVAEVIVDALPDSELHEAVRNLTSGGAAGVSAAASPGDLIEFRLTYHNHGSGPASAVVVTDPVPSATTATSCGGGCSLSGGVATWDLRTQPPGASIDLTLQARIDATFDRNEVTIVNVGSVDTGDEDASDSNMVEVLVHAPPDPVVAKAVRNVSDDGAFAAGADAVPGDVIEYRLTYRNGGSGPASAVTISDPIPARSTFLACTGCDVVGDVAGWSVGDVAAGGAVEVTFRVRLDDAFPSGRTDVHNVAGAVTAPLGTTASADAVVTVRAAPDLTLGKTTDVTDPAPGDLITYTIDHRNDGNGHAGRVTIADTVPLHTSFVSCSAGCAVAQDAIVWDLGEVASGDDGLVMLTVRVTAFGTCQVCNVASIASPDQGGGPVASNRACVAVRPPPGDEADADGRAHGISATLLGGTSGVEARPNTDVENPGTLTEMDVPGLLHVEALRVVESSSVSSQIAVDSSIAIADDVTVTVGDVQVRARGVVARSVSSAAGSGATSGRGGSRVGELVVNGTRYADVTEPLSIVVRDGLGRAVGEVDVLRTVGDTTDEGAGRTFSSRLTVDAIRVLVYDRASTTALVESSEVVIAHAESAASFVNRRPCGEIPTVAGEAFILGGWDGRRDAGTSVTGRVTLPQTGGSDDARVAETTALGSVAGTTHTDGTLDPHESSSFAEYDDLSMFGGSITAKALRAESASALLSSTGTTTLERLRVGDREICLLLGATGPCVPEPNTVVSLQDAGVIMVLNEQIPGPSGGLRVNAIHLYVVGGGASNQLRAGAEVIVASAFSFQGFLLDPPG